MKICRRAVLASSVAITSAGSVSAADTGDEQRIFFAECRWFFCSELRCRADQVHEAARRRGYVLSRHALRKIALQ